MKKQLLGVAACALIGSTFLQGGVPLSSQAKKTVGSQIKATTPNKEKQGDKTGLLGYYFQDKDLKKLSLMSMTTNGHLSYETESANKLLKKTTQEYQAVRWVGLIKSEQAGNFSFQLTNDKYATIKINGEIISEKGQNKKTVQLNKGEKKEIEIIYQPQTTLTNEDLKGIKLQKKSSAQNWTDVKQNELFIPYSNAKASLKDATLPDSDKDNIPDEWEKNGYTVKDRNLVKWDDSLGAMGYQKYVSNPYKKYTTADPYSDYDKVMGLIPNTNAKATKNPLIAAFPRVNVGLEDVALSKRTTTTESIQSVTQTNWSYTNTEEVTINAGLGWDSQKGFNFSAGVSTKYGHAETVAKQWGQTIGKTFQLMEAEAASLNANMRYYNIGTGAIYEVAPTVSLVLDNTTISTNTAPKELTANGLLPDSTYPSLDQTGISLSKNSTGKDITLNKQQFESYTTNSPLLMNTNQTSGKYAKLNEESQIVIGGDWNGIEQEISTQTASIMIDSGSRISERKIAAKDYSQAEDDGVPSLTFKQAMKLAYPEEVTEKGGILYYKDKVLDEASVMMYIDEKTRDEIKKQIESTTGVFKDVKKLYDVKITPKMNFTIKLAALYDNAEDNKGKVPFGNWLYTYQVPGGNTGKKQYRSHHPDAGVRLTAEAKKKLTPDTKYYLSLYMKAYKDTTPTIEVQGENGKIVSEQVKLTNNGYQRVDILVKNMEDNPIKQIFVRGDYKTDVYWDDVSLTEISHQKTDLLSESDVKKAHTFKYENYYYESIWRGPNSSLAGLTMNVKPVTGTNGKPAAFEYKVMVDGKELDQRAYKPNSQGDITFDFLKMNSNNPISKDSSIQIYAVHKNQEIKVAELNKYTISGKINFSNDGESGGPELGGTIDLYLDKQGMSNGAIVHPINLWNDLYDADDKWSVSYKKDFASFQDQLSKFKFSAAVYELDDTNGSDQLAYPSDEKTFNTSKGSMKFQGDESGSYVRLDYEVVKNEN
ncbi:binary toxin-like calcium binding domain-containing protein [Listeria sp. PSOL-1]|uniref:binary toxin-like calcium binding domain-containing protein n=1 Tax=Listeria sp. PSOL-1 TaxID=1844999 RepID=UPI0013D81012|nr:binary toxin-like calcium binding domain-containing protein [Listeria sp. PSOL-1]